MAAPLADKVILPLDTGNTGKKVRTQTRVVGADTVHEHFYIPISREKIDGIYNAQLPLQSVQASAHNGTSTAFFWLENPVANTKRARIRKIEIAFTIVTEVDHLTAPRIQLHRFTFTGTASGASVTPGKRKSTDGGNTVNLRTAVTGMTVALVAPLWGAIAPTLTLTTSGLTWNATPPIEFDPTTEDDFFDLAPGEGALLYQPDAGTASDGRRFGLNIRWDEVDNA